MPTSFAIVTMGRCGSTLLADLLSSHPEIECGGEMLTGFRDIAASEFLERHAFKTARPIRGFKAPFIQLIDHTDLIGEFVLRSYKVIRLRRANTLDHFLSVKLALLNDNWGSNAPYEREQLKVDPWDLAGFARSRQVQEWVMDRFRQRLDQIAVTYETLLSPTTQAAILAFLGAKPAALSTTKIRSRSGTAREIIENYDAIAKLFAGTEHAGLLR